MCITKYWQCDIFYIFLFTCPRITSDTSFELTLALLSTSEITMQPNWWAFKDDNEPPNEPRINT